MTTKTISAFLSRLSCFPLALILMVGPAMANPEGNTAANEPEVTQSSKDIVDAISDAPASESFLDAIAAAGEEANIGGFIFPHFHAFGVFGDSTADPADLAVNVHDPNNQATLQALEVGTSVRAGMIQGFANAVGVTTASGDFDFQLEEGFAKVVDLPLGLSVRGGQFFNRFGFQNSVHNHGWMFVDQNLVNGRFLNEGEMITQGGEVSWKVPLKMMQASVISASVGGAPAHGHGEEDHGHGHGEESEFEGEGANFNGTLVNASWVNQYDINDMNRMTGIFSGAWGQNDFGRNTQVYGIGFEYLWRENGYSAGGNSLRWRTEAMIRGIDAVSGHLHGEEEEEHHDDEHDHHEEEHHDEHHHDEDHHDEDDHHDDEEEEHHDDEERRFDSFDEFGIYSMLVYGINDRLETGVRAGWVGGVSEMGLDDRFRLSPMVTWYANEKRTLQTRIQYNWDHSNDFGDEHSIWFQIGFNWGGPEVR